MKIAFLVGGDVCYSRNYSHDAEARRQDGMRWLREVDSPSRRCPHEYQFGLQYGQRCPLLEIGTKNRRVQRGSVWGIPIVSSAESQLLLLDVSGPLTCTY